MIKSVLPGSTLGMLGSGQLGRMFAIAARRLGYRVHVYSPESDTPTGQVADKECTGDYEDADAVARFARDVDVVSYEFENVPLATLEAVQSCGVDVFPSSRALGTAQNRVREKTFLREAGFPVTPFTVIESVDDAHQAEPKLAPGVLKTAAWGYDGKGQAKIESIESLVSTWESDFRQPCVLEQLVDFTLELSIVAARGADGQVLCYGPMENIHTNHILDITLCPGRVPEEVTREAVQIATAIMEALDVVGVLCVEMFLTSDGRVLVNELAPRPHNSGHLTIDAHQTCQFEQQVRAVCGLPLGSAALLRPAAMANLLGDLWEPSEPDWADMFADPHVKLHLYGKQTPKPGRKMGHVTALAETIDQAQQRVVEARNRLQRR